MIDANEPYGIKIITPSKPKGAFVGKFFRNEKGKLVFYRPWYKGAIFLKDYSFSFDLQVADFCKAKGVDVLHFEYGGNASRPWEATGLRSYKFKNFMRDSRIGDYGEKPQRYLPVMAWAREPMYKPPEVPDEQCFWIAENGDIEEC